MLNSVRLRNTCKEKLLESSNHQTCGRQVEGRNKTKERARRFIATVSQENMNCAVITHGFYMHTLLDEMKKAGFRTNRSLVGYNNGEYVIAEK